jgi:hypothetical protein
VAPQAIFYLVKSPYNNCPCTRSSRRVKKLVDLGFSLSGLINETKVHLVIAFILAVLPTSWAGDQQAVTTITVPYLLRMERLRSDQDVCVLVRRDGQYHLERLHRYGIRVFEGELPNGALGSLENLLTKDRLFQLQQSDIVVPHTTGAMDQLFVSVLRPAHWQNLEFDSAESRKPYEEFLNPLLKWLDDLQKKEAKELTEESGRNNCLPAREVKLQTRSGEKTSSQDTQAPEGKTVPAQEVRPNLSGTWKLNLSKSKLLRQHAPGDVFYKIKHVERRLEIVHQGDTYHYVTDGKVHVAFRGVLDDAELLMAKTYWDGETLVIETSQEIGPGGARWVSRYRLSEDGNSLTVTFHASQSKFRGAFDESLVYDKQQ